MIPNEHAGYHTIYGCDPGDCDKNSCTCKLNKKEDANSNPKERRETEGVY